MHESCQLIVVVAHGAAIDCLCILEALLAAGVTKAGYLLKRQTSSPVSNQWRSYFVVLNDHCLSYCSEKYNFERPDGNLLLTSGTRVYQQNDEAGLIRIETGFEVLLLKGKDEAEMKEWKRAIHANVGRLAELARGKFRVKSKGRVKEFFLMMHRECITCHPTFSQTVKILKIYQLTEKSSFDVRGESIEFKSGGKGDETLTMTANNDIEHQHWCFALDIAISRLQNGASKTIVPPPHLPVHSGTLQVYCGKKHTWQKKYVVLTEDSLYMHAHRRVGFGVPLRHALTPNTMIFSTTLKDHSFELVLFSDSIHLSASSDAERGEWIFVLQKLIPRSSYDESDPLQMASLEKDLEVLDTEFHSESPPGILLERRGNWAIAALVSESLSRKVCQGSVLSKVGGEPTLMVGFDSVVTALSYWKPPLQLSFHLSPRKMGWLTLMVKESGRSWLGAFRWKRDASSEWEKVYATLSSGVLSLFTIKKDGKSKKRSFGLHGSAVGLVESNLVDGNKNCFRVLDGLESITLQAQSRDSMMEWSTAIAHSISMENGGGLLLDKEKVGQNRTGQASESSISGPDTQDGYLDSAGFPTSPIFRRVDHEVVAKQSIVFSKPVPRIEHVGCSKVTLLEPITEKVNVTHTTEETEDVNTTFNSLDPVDLSHSMEEFARNFFVINGKAMGLGQVPTQELRGGVSQPWLTIDRASSASSGSEIFDKVSDFDESTHINPDDFAKLVQFTKEARMEQKV